MDLVVTKRSLSHFLEGPQVPFRSARGAPPRGKDGQPENGEAQADQGFARPLLECEPPGFRDVVIVHQLVHLRIQNQGKLFKSFLNSLIPGWESEIEGKANRICR